MNPISLVGAFVITLSLLAYGIGTITLQRFRLVSREVLVFLTAGLVLDVVASVLMIIGSRSTPFTIHGILGYSAILVMAVDVYFVWMEYVKNGIDVVARKKTLWYAKYAYGWWVIAYISGSMLVLWR